MRGWRLCEAARSASFLSSLGEVTNLLSSHHASLTRDGIASQSFFSLNFQRSILKKSGVAARWANQERALYFCVPAHCGLTVTS